MTATPQAPTAGGLGAGIVLCALGAVASIVAFFVLLLVNIDGPPGWVFAVLALPVPLVAIAIVLATIRGRRVRSALAAHATSRGWKWSRRPTPQQTARTAPFKVSARRGPLGTVEGSWEGVPFLATTIAIRSGRNWAETDAVLVPMPIPSPGLAIVPQALGRLAWLDNPFRVGEDIGLDSAEFSRAYWVASRDRRFAVGALDAAMMEHLLAMKWPGAIVWHGRILAVTVHSDKLSNEMTWESLEAALPVAVGVRKRVPRSLAPPAPPAASQ